MPEYSLHYLNCRGLCEPLRYCLHYAGIPFEDKRFTFAEFPKYKESYPNKQVPVFYVDGKPLTQSGAILRYVARLTGLNGKDSWEEAKADETFHFFHDSLIAHLRYLLHKANIKPIEDVEAAYAEFIPPATKALEVFTKMLEEAGNGYVLKSGLTYADFVVQSYVTTLRHLDEKLVQKYPKVLEHFEKIKSIPQLQKYISTRSDTVN